MKNNSEKNRLVEEIEDTFGDFLPEDECPLAKNAVMSLAGLPKPFGLPWKRDKIIKFLEERGYTIIERTTAGIDGIGENYSVAVKPDDEYIPQKDNLLDTFQDEVQDILINWLLTL